ncbi:MAG: glycosyltransferase [Verrucomicrobia bacterium]|nr:glycosyltransferase [Verrucomicrobiota bacterium]
MAKAHHKVLILSTSAGTGHLRAASALEKVCRNNPGVDQVAHVDALAFTNKLFRDFYSKLYIRLVEDAPTLLGWWYEKSDEPWKTDRMRLLLDRLNTRPLIRLLSDLQPDITICTHFMPAEIISHLISRQKIRAKLSIVVTDYDFHAMWLSRAFHRYFVALDETKAYLSALGLPPERITVSGIPVDPAFAQNTDKAALRKQLQLQPDQPVILVSAGALGVNPAEQVVKSLRNLTHRSQVVVICGKNPEAKRRVEAELRRGQGGHAEFRVLSYVDDMPNWMGAADLLVSKPGGMTSAEAMASGLPMAIYDPIPGQEERNSDQLLEKGVAIKCNEISILGYKVNRLLGEAERLQAMQAAARRLGRPDAAETIVQTLLDDPEQEPIRVGQDQQEEMAESVRKR